MNRMIPKLVGIMPVYGTSVDAERRRCSVQLHILQDFLESGIASHRVKRRISLQSGRVLIVSFLQELHNFVSAVGVPIAQRKICSHECSRIQSFPLSESLYSANHHGCVTS
jgi:hypothetical protein